MNPKHLEIVALIVARSLHGLIGVVMGFHVGFLRLCFVKDWDHLGLLFGIPMLVVGIIAAIFGDKFLGLFTGSPPPGHRDRWFDWHF